MAKGSRKSGGAKSGGASVKGTGGKKSGGGTKPVKGGTKPAASGRTVKAIGKSDFLALVRSSNATNAKIAEERGALGAKVAYAVENKHLHKSAFGLTARLARMDGMKLAEWLFHFDLYREHLELDTLKAADMLDDRAGGADSDGEGEEDGIDAEGDPAPEAVAAGEPDVRPPHLVQREADREAEGGPGPAPRTVN